MLQRAYSRRIPRSRPAGGRRGRPLDSPGPAADASPARLIRTRYATLDVDGAQLFALLVVAAQPLGIEDAAKLLDWEERRAHRAVQALADRALVVQAGVMSRPILDRLGFQPVSHVEILLDAAMMPG